MSQETVVDVFNEVIDALNELSTSDSITNIQLELKELSSAID